MKKIILILFVGLTLSGISQDVPQAAKNTFSKMYPGANEVEWSFNDLDYEVQFYFQNSSCLATFDEEGKWVYSEINLTKSQLPKPIISAVTTKFSGVTITSAVKQLTLGMPTKYLVNANAENINYEIVVDEKGKILSSETYEDGGWDEEY